MNDFSLLVTITDRPRLKSFVSFYGEYGVTVGFVSLGFGTAVSEVLDTFGLEAQEKVVVCSVITGETKAVIMKDLKKKMRLELPGAGIAFTVPLSSAAGLPQLKFLAGEQNVSLKEESVLKDTEQELLIVISDFGYSDTVMEAARGAGARGGTVLHTKGTGMRGAEKFLGVSLASEKEMIYIVVRRSDKNRIMQAINEKAGLETKAKSIMFSIPVTSSVGIKFPEE